jgi:hypothetical protein
MSDARPLATCGLCDWRLEGDDMEALKVTAYEHVEKVHPVEWDEWMKAQRNAHYFLTGEGGYEQ